VTPDDHAPHGSASIEDEIRGLLNRKVLAAYRQRLAVAQHLGMTESEVTALAYLAQGPLTPSELGASLLLTSGGVTALLRRLEADGHITRERHPKDRRKVVVRVDRAIVGRAAECHAELARAIDEVTRALPVDDQETVRAFLAAIADVSESSADALVADGDEPPAQEVIPIWA
jgi:DNA-binding MarR family transcriptional regulator